MGRRGIREPGHLSVSAYARHRGTDAKAVRTALAKGVFELAADGFVDPIKADAAWEANSDPAYRHSNVRTGSTGLAEARTRSELLKIDAAQWRLDQKRAEIIDRRFAISSAKEFERRVRASWRAWPERVASRVAADLGVDADRLRRVLERHVVEQLNAMPPEDVTDLLAPGRRGASG